MGIYAASAIVSECILDVQVCARREPPAEIRIVFFFTLGLGNRQILRLKLWQRMIGTTGAFQFDLDNNLAASMRSLAGVVLVLPAKMTTVGQGAQKMGSGLLAN